jgi:hypothetical protein
MGLKDNKEWAPHVHNPEDASKVEPWLRGLLEYEAFTAIENVDPRENSHLERLLWIIGLQAYGYGDDSLPIKDVKLGFYADQWVGVSADVTFQDGSTEHYWTEGDSFLLALAKTIERIKARW